MSLQLYNTLTRKKEVFVPLQPGKVSIYACGITAYDSCHLGHARSAMTFDMIVRYLRYRGFDVTFVRNFTDIDDKIIARANERGLSTEELSEHYIAEYQRDMAALGLLPPTLEPKATEHIREMIFHILTLIEQGMAYALDGSVYFSVRKFSSYGKLSGKKIEELESGARVEVDEKKQDPLDFALWKASKPGEPKWLSPWGEGRPGWHIECSAMSTKYLGQPFDIHGGGRDLQFPHHENEIAQSEGAYAKPFARYWMHNGFININAEKMSKSLGNIATIAELLKHHHPEVIRFFILSNHYRSPIDYTAKAMEQAKAGLDRFYETAARLVSADQKEPGSYWSPTLKVFPERFVEAMDDDFNTAEAIGLVFEIVRELNRGLDRGDAASAEMLGAFQQMQKTLGTVLGVFGQSPDSYLRENAGRALAQKQLDSARIELLLAERAEARKKKDFKRSDEIRDELARLGVELKDRPDGTTEWKI